MNSSNKRDLSAFNKAIALSPAKTTGISPFMEIELTLIIANPNQPRKHFDALALQELADSIRTDGLMQPIVVVKKDGGYMIVSGERRFRASKIVGVRTIKAHALTADEYKVQELALIENIQREDLTDLEIAKAVGDLWASGNYPQKSDLAKAIGKSPSYVSKVFSALNLDDTIIADIQETKQDIPLSVLQEMGRIQDPAVQKEVYQKYTAKEITREDFKEIANPKSQKLSHGKQSKSTYRFNAKGDEISSMLNTMLDQLDIDPKKRFKITIEEV